MNMKCQICQRKLNRRIYGVHIHHFIKQQQYAKNKRFYDENNIKQKKIPLCFKCHDIVHTSFDDKKFNKQLERAYSKIFNLKLADYIFIKKHLTY